MYELHEMRPGDFRRPGILRRLSDRHGILPREARNPGKYSQTSAEKVIDAAKKEKPEEIIDSLRKKARFWRIIAAVLFLLLCLSVSLLGWHYATTDHAGFGIGQNYSTETQTPGQ